MPRSRNLGKESSYFFLVVYALFRPCPCRSSQSMCMSLYFISKCVLRISSLQLLPLPDSENVARTAARRHCHDCRLTSSSTSMSILKTVTTQLQLEAERGKCLLQGCMTSSTLLRLQGKIFRPVVWTLQGASPHMEQTRNKLRRGRLRDHCRRGLY